MATDVETGKLKQCYDNAHDEPVYKLICLNNDKIVTGKLQQVEALTFLLRYKVILGLRAI